MSHTVLLATSDVADRLGVSRATVVRWAESGRLRVDVQAPGSRGANLYAEADVEALKSDLEFEGRRSWAGLAAEAGMQVHELAEFIGEPTPARDDDLVPRSLVKFAREVSREIEEARR